MGISQRHELRSRIAVIIEHLLKLECSPAKEPRPGSMLTIGRERGAIERLFEDSPSLKGAPRTSSPRNCRAACERLAARFGFMA